MTESTTPAPDALAASINSTKPVLATFDVGDTTFNVIRKPGTLLLAELARTGSGDPEAIGVLAEFFQHTLGKEAYGSFKRAFYALDVDDETSALMGYLAEVLEKTLGRPTQ